MKKVAICCGSSNNCPDIYKQHAKKIAQFLAQQECKFYIDASDFGLMKIIREKIPEKNIKAFSVRNINKKSFGIVCDTNDDRKKIYKKECDIFLILPGGYGSLDELCNFICLNYIGEINKPIILYNINNFWDPLLEMIFKIYKENFSPKVGQYLNITKSFELFKASFLHLLL